MELLAIALISVAVLGFSAWREYLMHQERKELEVERSKMLDRLMSKDLIQYKELDEPATSLEDDKQDEVEDDSFPLTTRELTSDELSEVYGTN